MRGTKGRITEIDTYNNIQCDRELQEVHNIQEREKKQNWTSHMSLPSKFKKVTSLSLAWSTGGRCVLVRCQEEQGVLMSDMAHCRRQSHKDMNIKILYH